MERPINKKRVVLAGGSGFLGERLAKELLGRNYEVVVLTRSPRERSDGVREVEWSGTHIGEWIECLDGVDAVVNLAGRSINCRESPCARLGCALGLVVDANRIDSGTLRLLLRAEAIDRSRFQFSISRSLRGAERYLRVTTQVVPKQDGTLRC